MKINWKKLLISLAIPIATGGLAGWITSGAMDVYDSFEKPFLSPPGWLFPVVWTVLYALMGLAFYLAWTTPADMNEKKKASILYFTQLALNFIWPIVFFSLEMPLAAFFVLAILWILIYLTIQQFSAINERAGDLLLPYILWVSCAGYLNLGIYLLNSR